MPLRIVSEVTLRDGCDRVEISTTVENTVSDHRVRVLFPTGLGGETFDSDAPFDVVTRPIKLRPDNDERRELDLETRPQQSWTAFGDGTRGLAVVARGLPEVAVRDTPDRPIALTLLRGFKRVISRDDDTGGQVLGTHVFRYDLVPFQGATPTKQLFLLGQRLHAAVRQTSLPTPLVQKATTAAKMPRSQGFVAVTGDAVVTSVRRHADSREVRMFNPTDRADARRVRDRRSQKPNARWPRGCCRKSGRGRSYARAQTHRHAAECPVIISLHEIRDGHSAFGQRVLSCRRIQKYCSPHEKALSARLDAVAERLAGLKRRGQFEILERRTVGDGGMGAPECGPAVDACDHAGRSAVDQACVAARPM